MTLHGLRLPAGAVRKARGTATVDNVARDVLYALRAFRRAPLAALTIVATLGLGLALVTVVFTFLNRFVFRVDQVHNPYELFAVERQRTANADGLTFTRAESEAFVRDTGVFSDAFARTGDFDAWIDGTRLKGGLVTGNFFQVLGVGAARGRTLTPSDDQLGGAMVMVISHRAWTTRFARDPDVLTRPVLVNGARFQIIGIMPDGFRGLMVAPLDFWAPLALAGQFRPAWRGHEDTIGLGLIGRLRTGVSPGQALAQVRSWDVRRAADRGLERPAASLVLEPRLGTLPQPAEALVLFMPLFFAFGLVLMIGCANVANLLLARGVARQREIGVRLAIGASRGRIIRQLLTESLVLALVSAALGLVLSRLLLAALVHALRSTFPPDFGDLRLFVPPVDWRVVLFLLAGAVMSTLVFALAPALRATRGELVRAIRGEVMRDARPGRARDALVALQVTGSVLLLICAAIFLRSSWAASTVDPGIRTADILHLGILDEERRGAVLDIVSREPSVAAMAAAWPAGLGGRPAVADGAAGRSSVIYQFVTPEYFGVLDIDLVRGRGFTPLERSPDHAVAVVSERVAAHLWPGADAVGQILQLESDPKTDPREANDPPPPARRVVVVGVARDVAGFRLGGSRMAGAGVYLPISAEAAKTSLAMQVRGDVDRARRGLVDRMAAVDPGMGELSALRTVARMEAYLLAIPFWLTLALGSLALVLTLSGLFSVLSYLVAQRTQEIGVRMALGATSRTIAALVLAQTARPVGIGLLLGGGLTAALGALLLATPAAEGIGSSVHLFDPVAWLASILSIIAACASAALLPALRAGRTDPVGALRQD